MLVKMCMVAPSRVLKAIPGGLVVPGMRVVQPAQFVEGEIVVGRQDIAIDSRLRRRGADGPSASVRAASRRASLIDSGIVSADRIRPQPHARNRSACAPWSKHTTNSLAAITADRVYM